MQPKCFIRQVVTEIMVYLYKEYCAAIKQNDSSICTNVDCSPKSTVTWNKQSTDEHI